MSQVKTYACQKYGGAVHRIFRWEHKNNTMFQSGAQQKSSVKKFVHVICHIVHTFGMKIGHVLNVVREIDAITTLL